MLENWGYQKLYERISHESDDERGHVAKLVQRILLLEGEPDVAARSELKIGTNPKQILENDLALELAKDLNEAIALCRDQGDNGTREMLEELLNDTERDHACTGPRFARSTSAPTKATRRVQPGRTLAVLRARAATIARIPAAASSEFTFEASSTP